MREILRILKEKQLLAAAIAQQREWEAKTSENIV